MTIFEAIVFISHYSFFFLTALFFILKLHKKKKALFFTTCSLWIVFGFLGFFIELSRFLEFIR